MEIETRIIALLREEPRTWAEIARAIPGAAPVAISHILAYLKDRRTIVDDNGTMALASFGGASRSRTQLQKATTPTLRDIFYRQAPPAPETTPLTEREDQNILAFISNSSPDPVSAKILKEKFGLCRDSCDRLIQAGKIRKVRRSYVLCDS